MTEVHHPKRVHRLMANAYFFFFFLFICGVLLDLIFPISISNNIWMQYTGFVFLIVGTILVFWAQIKGKILDAMKENIDKYVFRHGPYRFTKTPTLWGLLFLTLGFGFIANAFFVIFLAVISFSATKLTFAKKLEKIFTEKYGEAYLEYKKMVHL